MNTKKQILGSTYSMDHGTEGPHHDPYGYQEFLCTKRDGRTMVLHLGLGAWLKVDGKEVDSREEKELIETFEQFIGAPLRVLEKAIHKLQHPSKCPNCGSKKFYDAGGFPGESYELCCTCNHVVSYHFNESAII